MNNCMVGVIWKDFEKKLSFLLKLCNGKKVLLWGYDRSGWFIEHCFKRRNCSIDYIIDDGANICPKIKVYRSIVLEDLDSRTSVVLCTFNRTDDLVLELRKKEYKENENLFFLKNYFYGDNVSKNRMLSYYDWIESEYGCDIIRMICSKDMSFVNSDCLYYSPGIDYALKDVIDNFVFDIKDAVFDFGFGKGGALLLFKEAGVGIVGGVEYDEKIYNIACDNYKKLGIEDNYLLQGDATEVKEQLDLFNYFFFYNPFQGETFRSVIKNIQESLGRLPRKVTIIYAGSYCSRDILKDGIFVLSKQIYTDYSVRYVNVYMNIINNNVKHEKEVTEND